MKQLIAQLRTIGALQLYRTHTSLFFQGEVPRHVTVILDGVVKAYTISPEGEETIVSLFGRGSVIPAAWVNNHAGTALFNYSALNDVRVITVQKIEFFALINQNPELQREYLEHIMQSQAELLLRVTGLSQSRAIDKICYTLFFLLFRYSIDRGDGYYEIDLKLTQGLLANLIGQTRESTAKNLKTLRELGIIEYTSSTYLVNKRKLEQYLGEDAFRDMTL